MSIAQNSHLACSVRLNCSVLKLAKISTWTITDCPNQTDPLPEVRLQCTISNVGTENLLLCRRHLLLITLVKIMRYVTGTKMYHLELSSWCRQLDTKFSDEFIIKLCNYIKIFDGKSFPRVYSKDINIHFDIRHFKRSILDMPSFGQIKLFISIFYTLTSRQFYWYRPTCLIIWTRTRN